MDIYDRKELKSALLDIVEDVIDEVTGTVLLSLQQYILKDVYHSNNQWYHDGTKEPTYEFYKSWDWSEKTRNDVGGIIKQFLSYDPDKMEFDPTTWKHGSYISGDVRDKFAAIMNRDTRLSSLPMTRPTEPFWDHFIDEMLGDGQLERMFDQAMRSRGIQKI